MSKAKLRITTIRIVGEINEDAFNKFSEELEACEVRGDKEVNVELNSGGGSTYDALAFCSRIRLSSCRIIITAHGLAASAAVLILAVGHYRRIAKEAWVMVHEDSGKLRGNVTELQRDAEQMRKLERQWNLLLEEHTGRLAEFWAALHSATTYLDAQECKFYNLVDEVL